MKIFGIKINKLKYKKFLSEIMKLEKQNIVFTPNPEILLKTKSDKEFKNLLEKATYLTPDGIGLYVAFQIIDFKKKFNIGFLIYLLLPYFIANLFFRRKYLYKKYGDRICGSDLTKDVIKSAVKKSIKITILDLYNPNDDKKTHFQKHFRKLLEKKFKNLKFDYFIYNPEKKEEIIKKIKKSDSHILFSTLGMKAQEQSIIDILSKCDNIKLGMGIGSSFDYFTGFQKRAPKIWRKLGIEWFYRLITGPNKIKRLKRLWNAVVVFVFKVIKDIGKK